jgi:ABC-type nitrate/sulfonate/bicarbonate transport system ATPase subunit
MVTHDLDEAVFLSDSVVVLDQVPGPVTGTLDLYLPRPRRREDDALSQSRTQLLRVLQQAHAL